MRTGTEPPAPATDDAKARLEMVAIAGLIGIAAAVIFVGWPHLDVTVSDYFHLGPRKFALRHSELAETIRESFKLLNLTCGILVVLAIAAVIAQGRRFLSLGLAHWGFLALVLIVGPGLLANSTLKDNWGRPRPVQITEFGGPAAFAPALARTGPCEKNCSFVSGEASSTFALGFALTLLARRRRAAWMAAGLAAGSVVGLIRIGQGGHFLSDVIFAAVFMALVVAGLHLLVFRLLASRIPGEAWWHKRAVAAWHSIRRQTDAPVAIERG